MSKICKSYNCFSGFSQSPMTTHATDDDVINDVVQYDYCKYGEQVFRPSNRHSSSASFSAVLSQHLRHIWRKCCDNFTPPWAKFFDWQISHAYFSGFRFTCKHVETKLKQNNFTETKHCFAFVLFQFYLSYNHCISCSLVVDIIYMII